MYSKEEKNVTRRLIKVRLDSITAHWGIPDGLRIFMIVKKLTFRVSTVLSSSRRKSLLVLSQYNVYNNMYQNCEGYRRRTKQ